MGGILKAEERVRRQGVFLHVLARTGNVTRAAEDAGFPKSSLTRDRREDTRFAAEWAAALAAASEALGAIIDQGSAETGRWVRRLRGGQAQEAKPRGKAWSQAREAAFLETLAAECHVGQAAAAARMSKAGCYLRRKTRPEFARAWDDAIEEARQALAIKLLRQAANGTRAGANNSGEAVIAGPDEDRAIPDTALALGMLKLYATKAGKQTETPRHEEPPIEEVRASILRKIDAIERAERTALLRGEQGREAEDPS